MFFVHFVVEQQGRPVVVERIRNSQKKSKTKLVVVESGIHRMIIVSCLKHTINKRRFGRY